MGCVSSSDKESTPEEKSGQQKQKKSSNKAPEKKREEHIEVQSVAPESLPPPQQAQRSVQEPSSPEDGPPLLEFFGVGDGDDSDPLGPHPGRSDVPNVPQTTDSATTDPALMEAVYEKD